jgi:hypothetical protein
MASGGVLANGIKVGYSTTSPHTWTTVTQVTDVQGVATFTSDSVDTTVHGTSRLKRSIPGMISVDDLVVTCLLDPDTMHQNSTGWVDDLYDFLAAGTKLWWRVEIPVDNAQSQYQANEFEGRVKAIKPNFGEPSNRQEIQFTVGFDGNDVYRLAPGPSVL